MNASDNTIVSDELVLNYHLRHPFCLDGTYHLHYIMRQQCQGKRSYSFIHVTSPDMLHWTWQPTKLQPSFTDHGMFSGTGFITKDGRPAAIYAGVSDPRFSYISIAKDAQLSSWEKPYPLMPKGGPEGKDVGLLGDPDCFRVGDTYYAFSAAENVPLCNTLLHRSTVEVIDINSPLFHSLIVGRHQYLDITLMPYGDIP